MKNELYNEHKARQNVLLVKNVKQSQYQLEALYKVIDKRGLTRIQAYNKMKGQTDTLLHKADLYGGYQHERYKGKKHDLALLLTDNYFIGKV